MSFISKNPYTSKVLKEVDAWSKDQTKAAIDQLHEEYLANKKLGSDKCQYKIKKSIEKLANAMENHKKALSEMLSIEMGKPIKESQAEVQKTIDHCRYYAEKMRELLEPKIVKNEDGVKKGYLYDPLGVAYKITPFNFPIWIALKMVIPSVLTVNTVLIRPPGCTPQTLDIIQKIFEEAEFKSAMVGFINKDDTDFVMSQNEIIGVSFTGSTAAGFEISELAGKNLKRCVLELGGNDPFIVLKDADINLAAELAAKSRLKNAGQVCFASKRFIVEESVMTEFIDQLKKQLDKVKLGDPLSEDTTMGPIAKDEYTKKYVKQLKEAVEAGDEVIYGNKEPEGNLVGPSIFKVKDLEKSVLTVDEVFGPVFAIIPFTLIDHAIELANKTQYGLGATIVSKDTKNAELLARQIDAALIYINDIVTSDSMLPFGGVKQSGFGRDLGTHGIESFSNVKTFSVKSQASS